MCTSSMFKRSHDHHFLGNYRSVIVLIWRRQWQPTPVLLPGKSHGWRSLVGCSPWGRKKSDTTEQLHFHFSLSCIGEGNGNPLQGSCLENSRDGGAWWAAISGVAQSRTQLSDFLFHALPQIYTELPFYKAISNGAHLGHPKTEYLHAFL